MRAVLQRVLSANIVVNDENVSSIGRGILVFLAVQKGDDIHDVNYIVDKCINLRIFQDDEGKMNYSVKDIQGEILVVSQFTLLADCRKGRRPSFTDASDPQTGLRFYEEFIRELSRFGVPIKTGIFRADMKINLINDGPVTLILDSRKIF